MKTIIFALSVRIISLLLLIKSESIPNISKNESQNQIISKIQSFSGFWEIKLSKPFRWISTIGYKEEAFDKNKLIYAFKYQFINLSGIILPINPSAQWKIILDKNFNIKNIQAIIWKKYLVNADIETWNILKINIKEIWKINPIYSKILKTEKLNLNFFLLYAIPYLDLKKWKKYKFQTLDILSIKDWKPKQQDIFVEKIDKNKYKLQTNWFEQKLIFENWKLTSIRNPIFIEQLIKNPTTRQKIIDQIESKYKRKSQKPTLKKENTITQKIKNLIDKENLNHTDKYNTNTETKNEVITTWNQKKENLLDINIWKIVQKIQKEKQRKICPIIKK